MTQNIITYSPYSSYFDTKTSANASAVLLSRGTDGNHVTSLFKRFYKDEGCESYLKLHVKKVCFSSIMLTNDINQNDFTKRSENHFEK